MKVSPPSPPMSAKEQEEEPPHHDDLDTANNCSKRRRLHSQTNIIINGHYRQRKHIYPRDEDKSSSIDCFDVISNNVNSNSNSSCNSSNSGEDASDCDDTSMAPSSYPNQQNPEGKIPSSPPPDHDKKDDYRQTTVVNHISGNNEENFMTPATRNAVQQLAANSDNKITLSLSTHSEKNNESESSKITHDLTISTRSDKLPTINEKNQSVINTDFDDPTITANDCRNSEISNDECLSQSPLNLTRSQGSSEGGNKSEDYDEEDYDESEEKNGFGHVINEEENIANGHNLPTTEAPFPWNIALSNNNNNNNKQKQQSQDDKITAQPPQLLLTSGHLTTGCLQAAQLLIPTARGIMTQTILAIPINDMVSSAITASTSNQQQLQQQLLYHSSNNIRQKSINRQQLNQTCQPSLSLPLSRYFQQQKTSADDTTSMMGTPDNVDNNSHDMVNDGAISTDQYNSIQQRKWQSSDLTSKKHNFLTPQQKLLRVKNGESGDLMNATNRPKESSTIQTPSSTNVDCRIYSNNNAATITTAMTPMSPPTLKRNGSNNGGGVDVIQRQTVWPTAVTATDQHNGGDNNDNEGELFTGDKQQPSHVISPGPPTSSANMNTLKSLAPPSSQLNCHIKPSKDEDSAAAAAAAAYNQQNAICTALATHMLCASQLAAAQQPMFDNLDNSNAVKKSNHVYNNNNNNNNIKTNNMMGVNPSVLEKWIMDERYYYNNNNNNNKNIAGVHSHHQRYNAAAAAAAAAAVELLSSGVSASSSGGGAGDSLASCKKRKRRTSFTPHALELLNGHFERNTHPSGSEITGLAHRLGYEREVIRIWFCNKRQALKNTVRTINGNGPTHMTSTKSHNNTSGY